MNTLNEMVPRITAVKEWTADELVWMGIHGEIELFTVAKKKFVIYFDEGEVICDHDSSELFFNVMQEKALYDEYKFGDRIPLPIPALEHLYANRELNYRYFSLVFPPQSDDFKLNIPFKPDPITYEDVFVDAACLPSPAGQKAVKKSPPKKVSVQEKRLEVFKEWLEGQNRADVEKMKKDDVWEQLRGIDKKLFSPKKEHFFKYQNEITFKSGRK